MPVADHPAGTARRALAGSAGLEHDDRSAGARERERGRQVRRSLRRRLRRRTRRAAQSQPGLRAAPRPTSRDQSASKAIPPACRSPVPWLSDDCKMRAPLPDSRMRDRMLAPSDRRRNQELNDARHHNRRRRHYRNGSSRGVGTRRLRRHAGREDAASPRWRRAGLWEGCANRDAIPRNCRSRVLPSHCGRAFRHARRGRRVSTPRQRASRAHARGSRRHSRRWSRASERRGSTSASFPTTPRCARSPRRSRIASSPRRIAPPTGTPIRSWRRALLPTARGDTAPTIREGIRACGRYASSATVSIGRRNDDRVLPGRPRDRGGGSRHAGPAGAAWAGAAAVDQDRLRCPNRAARRRRFAQVFGVANADCAGRQEADGRLRFTNGLGDWSSDPSRWTDAALAPSPAEVRDAGRARCRRAARRGHGARLPAPGAA